ncbi:hypothetical protein I4F81_002684 [Pyropia yezoensis]|uniref:Uncharacterized protein n=1 Tax=Pyropia yezoensis TaxID=2788 RepID=A0ACC3BR04_PYRYE|nr:hypothetical protein I4F81_002684 [Neopyropia yezoensis]
MGSKDGDGSPTKEEVIADLQGKLSAALEQLRTAGEATDANTQAVPAGSAPQGAVLASGAGDGAAPAGGGGAGRAAGGSGTSGGGGVPADPTRSCDADTDGGAQGSSPPESSSSDGDDPGPAPLGGLGTIKVSKPGEYLKDFAIPARAVKPDGLPVPFDPTDVTFLSAFGDNVRDRMEATSLYQVCYWLQEAINEATDSYHSHANYSAADLEACFASLVIYLKRLHRIAVKRYDYLETKQLDQLLAREYERADIPAVNLHRGFVSRVFRLRSRVGAPRFRVWVPPRRPQTPRGRLPAECDAGSTPGAA